MRDQYFHATRRWYQPEAYGLAKPHHDRTKRIVGNSKICPHHASKLSTSISITIPIANPCAAIQLSCPLLSEIKHVLREPIHAIAPSIRPTYRLPLRLRTSLAFLYRLMRLRSLRTLICGNACLNCALMFLYVMPPSRNWTRRTSSSRILNPPLEPGPEGAAHAQLYSIGVWKWQGHYNLRSRSL